MSNAFLRGEVNNPGEFDIISITPQEGTVVVADAQGNVNIFAEASSDYSSDGIFTDGSGDTLTVILSNSLSGSVATSNATPNNIISFDMGAVPAVYSFAGVVTGKSSTGDGCTYFLQSCFRTNGTSSTEIGTDDSVFFEDTSLSTCDALMQASANSAVVSVVGVVGDMLWDASFKFRRVL